MTDVMTPEQRSRCMRRIKGKDTRPELLVRRWLWSRGYRFRKNVRRLPGSPDIVLRKYGVVIFVHGCFWHGHETHIHIPKSNTEFWQTKIMHNRERDERQKARLRVMGWNVLTVWECQLRPAQRERTLAAVEYYINRSFLGMRGAVPLKGYDEGGGGYAVAGEPGENYARSKTPGGDE